MSAPSSPHSTTRVAPFTSARALSFSLPDMRPRRIPLLYRLGSSLWYAMPAHAFVLPALAIFVGLLPADLGEIYARGSVIVEGTVTSKIATFDENRSYSGTAIEVSYVVDDVIYVAKRSLGRDVILTYPEHPRVHVDPRKPRRADVEGTSRPHTAGLAIVAVVMVGFFVLMALALIFVGQRRAFNEMKLLERGVLTFAHPIGPGPQSAEYFVEGKRFLLPLTNKGAPLRDRGERVPVLYAERDPKDALLLEKAFLRPHIDEAGSLETNAWWQWPVALGAYGFVIAVACGVVVRTLVATFA